MQAYNSFVSYFGSVRVKLLALHAFSIGAVALLSDVASNLNLFSLPAWAVALIGLVLAQVIQGINGYLQNHPVTGILS